MISLRSLGKIPAEQALTRLGAARRARRRAVSDTMILAYHDIVPHGETPRGDRSLHIPRREFARQLDRLVQTHAVVSLADWNPEPIRSDRAPGVRARPRAILTFDDAYVGAVTCGVEELVGRGLPGTIFVAPQRLGRRTFWWDRVAEPGRGAPAPGVRERALTRLEGRDDRVDAWAREQGLPIADLPDYARTATEDELTVAASMTGITVASHSWSHANLAALDAAELDVELGASAEWLETLYSSYIPWISYPYGLSTEAVRSRAGRWYRGGLLIEGGWARAGDDPYARPRANIPAGVSLAGFELRACGLLGGGGA